MAEPKPPDIGQQADADCPALGNDTDIAGEAGRVAQLLQISRAAIMGAQHPHAVGPTERDAGVATDPFDPGLQPAPVLTAFGEPAIIDDGTPHSALSRCEDG